MKNIRYNELKYEGKVYTKKYQIDEILLKNEMGWVIDAELENARLEILKDTLVFNGGIWYNGIFEFGVVRDIEWRFGTFENGVWHNGTFKNGTINNGIIFGGKFLAGSMLGGEIRGGDFFDMKIEAAVKRELAVKENLITRFEDF